MAAIQAAVAGFLRLGRWQLDFADWRTSIFCWPNVEVKKMPVLAFLIFVYGSVPE